MKNFILFIMIGLGLVACMPARQTSYWMIDLPIPLEEFIEKKDKDMRDCGIDPFDGYHKSVKEGLCMETKGWYWTRGPVCEDWYNIDDPLCEEWRRKTGRPKPDVEKQRKKQVRW